MPKYVKATDASARTLALYNIVATANEGETKNDTVPAVPAVPSVEPGPEHSVSSVEPGQEHSVSSAEPGA
jgi:hypothetical protein